MRQYKFRAWDGSHMDYDYRDVSLWNGLLVAEGDTILMQFTGLQDKNGKDIYEGDIVRRYGKHIFAVTWDENFCGFIPLCEYRDDYGKPNAEENSQVTEVIGNIYEHPELLRQAI